jgi:hypothetical protein
MKIECDLVDGQIIKGCVDQHAIKNTDVSRAVGDCQVQKES